MTLTDKYNQQTEAEVKQGCLFVTQSTDIVILTKDEALKLAEFILKTYQA